MNEEIYTCKTCGEIVVHDALRYKCYGCGDSGKISELDSSGLIKKIDDSSEIESQ